MSDSVRRPDPFDAALGSRSRRGARWVPVARDGSATQREDDAHPHAVFVEVRNDEGRGQRFRVTVWVGAGDFGEVDVDAAVAFGEEELCPDSVAQDWGAV